MRKKKIILLLTMCFLIFNCRKESIEDINSGLLVKTQYFSDETLEAVKRAIVKKADVNARDEVLDSALHFVSRISKDNLKKDILLVAELLIKNGADINAQNYKKYTPLHFAVVSLHYELVEYLVDNGADINRKDALGYPPVVYAVMADDMKLVKYFAVAGADMSYFEPGFPEMDMAYFAWCRDYEELEEYLRSLK
ncbi:MAG: hypothetical protein GY756_12910 [bacterium]|nr:hypothetical protein [bacterium]